MSQSAKERLAYVAEEQVTIRYALFITYANVVAGK